MSTRDDRALPPIAATAQMRTFTHDTRQWLVAGTDDGAGSGPWVDERDKAHWLDSPTGPDCLAVRNDLGAWCGYVGLPDPHPLHGKDHTVPPSRSPVA